MTSKEALERLKFIADKELNTGSKSYNDLQEFWNYKEPLKVIEKLAERDTPIQVFDMGVDNRGIIRTFICPVCHQWLTFTEKENFCPKCGQRLNWND